MPPAESIQQNAPRVTIVSVVRDNTMYRQCIGDNPVLRHTSIIVGNNTVENRPVPYHYNNAIDSLLEQGYEGWIAFIHEDFQSFEPLEELLSRAETSTLWGPIGGLAKRIFGLPYKSRAVGSLMDCAKDGAHRRVCGVGGENGRKVEALDCACLFVHSSLFRQFPTLRFDEQCSFDMYVEELCYQAEELGIPRKILQFACLHHSRGAVTPRYEACRAHCQQKHPRLHISGGTCSAVLNSNVVYALSRFLHHPIQTLRKALCWHASSRLPPLNTRIQKDS